MTKLFDQKLIIPTITPKYVVEKLIDIARRWGLEGEEVAAILGNPTGMEYQVKDIEGFKLRVNYLVEIDRKIVEYIKIHINENRKIEKFTREWIREELFFLKTGTITPLSLMMKGNVNDLDDMNIIMDQILGKE